MTVKGTILAVDDTPASLRLLTDLLQADGYDVRSAISGEMALQSAIRNPPELILLDVRMPGMDGYEVCRRLKAQPGTRDVPVIFVSAASESDEKVLGFEMGAVDFVTKPFQREELLARVRTHHELFLLRNNLERLVDKRTANLNEAQAIAHVGSWEMDHATQELIWSDEVFRIFEVEKTQARVPYEFFADAIHPDDVALVDRAFDNSLLDKRPYKVVHRLLMPDGRIKWVEERSTNYFNEAGQPFWSVGSVQDVTEREEAALQLRIAAVAFDTQEAIMVTDRNARIVKVNRAFEQTTGYLECEVIGQNPKLLKSGRHDQAFYRALWASLESEGRWSGEVWDRRKDGEIYPKWLTITAVRTTAQITHYVAVFIDISERKKAEEEIRKLAYFDPLTNLPNRRLLLDRIQIAIRQNIRSRHYGALMFLDLDNFKVINDTKGHECGDKILVETARRLRDCVREHDSVARFGGDEFVVLLEGVGTLLEEAALNADLVAEKVRVSLSQPYRIGEHTFVSSPSIGVVLFDGDDADLEELFKHADLAMYKAKTSGKNQVRFFDPAMQQAVETRATLEADLRHALVNHEFRLYYQIQLDNDRKLLGAEALIRWLHPVRGLVPPVEFIPVAEESDLIVDIGRWVLEAACKQLVLWDNDQTRHLSLAVNVSAHQFNKPDFVGVVAEFINRYQISPARLKLELTESVVLNNVAEVVAKMHELRALGVCLSLDDFGTGYSSLSYLKQLPLNQLKIDQSFVRDMTADESDAIMVKTIVDLAHNFHLDVIAEGVETEAHLNVLKAFGCKAYQGYLFGRPVPVEQFEAQFLKPD